MESLEVTTLGEALSSEFLEVITQLRGQGKTVRVLAVPKFTSYSVDSPMVRVMSGRECKQLAYGENGLAVLYEPMV